MVNETLIKRVCALFAMTYALSAEEVWVIYLQTNSLDKTLETIQSK
jgi:hypothetical protein